MDEFAAMSDEELSGAWSTSALLLLLLRRLLAATVCCAAWRINKEGSKRKSLGALACLLDEAPGTCGRGPRSRL